MMFPSGGVNTKDWSWDEGLSMGCCGYLFVGVKAVTYFMRRSRGFKGSESPTRIQIPLE